MPGSTSRASGWLASDRRLRGDRGAAALELALILPLLLMIVFSVIDFGIVMSQKASLANAVRSGARYGSVNAYTTTHSCKSVIDRVRSDAQTIGIGAGNSTQVAVTVRRDGTTVCAAAAGVASPSVTAAPCTDAAGTPVSPKTLRVSASFVSNLPIGVPGLGSTVTISNDSAFQCEYY